MMGGGHRAEGVGGGGGSSDGVVAAAPAVGVLHEGRIRAALSGQRAETSRRRREQRTARHGQ